MDFGFSSEEERFKREVRDFFIKEEKLASEAKNEFPSGYGPACWEILRKLGAKGWLCPTWPKEYGGLELPYSYRYIILEQMQYFTNLLPPVGSGMAGPIILMQGSEEQKKKYLLRIAKGRSNSPWDILNLKQVPTLHHLK